MLIAVLSLCFLLLSSLPGGATSIIDVRLSTVGTVDLIMLFPVYEPLPDTDNLHADMRSAATKILTEHGIGLSDSSAGEPRLVVEIMYDQRPKPCSCIALVVNVALEETGTTARRWKGDRDSPAIRALITSWSSSDVRLIAADELAGVLREEVELTLTEFSEEVVLARTWAQSQ